MIEVFVQDRGSGEVLCVYESVVLPRIDECIEITSGGFYRVKQITHRIHISQLSEVRLFVDKIL